MTERLYGYYGVRIAETNNINVLKKTTTTTARSGNTRLNQICIASIPMYGEEDYEFYDILEFTVNFGGALGKMQIQRYNDIRSLET